MPDFPVVTVTPRPFAYISLTAPIAEMPKAMGEGFARLGASFAKAKAKMAGMPMAHYVDYDTNSASFQLGFPALPNEVETLRSAGLSIGETPGSASARRRREKI